MVYTAPQYIEPKKTHTTTSIFLAGTIDNGESSNWQLEFIQRFTFTGFNHIDFYNPRRTEWINNMKPTFDNSTFFQQVNWELDAMNKADIIIMNFLPNSKSPVSMLELGLYAKSGKLIVCCPDEFWRQGNVQIVCNNYNIPFYKTITEMLRNHRLFHLLK